MLISWIPKELQILKTHGNDIMTGETIWNASLIPNSPGLMSISLNLYNFDLGWSRDKAVMWETKLLDAVTERKMKPTKSYS